MRLDNNNRKDAMACNILKMSVEYTAKELVAEVYPAGGTYCNAEDGKGVKRGKKYYEAAEYILNALVAGSRTLVSDMSLSLADNASAAELKNAQEQLSGWLQRYDFEAGLNDYLMARAKPLVGRTTTLALDFSDISKAFGGKGMEGMAKGWDGSRHCTAYGHDFISVSVVGAGFADAVPVYVKLAKGRKSKGELLDEAIEAVKGVVGENGWFSVDRGMDSVEFVFWMKRRGYLGVVRVNRMDRDVFGTGRRIDEDFADVPFVKARLDTYSGAVTARVKWRPGVFTDECGSRSNVLVAESRVGGNAIWLYVTCPDSALDDPAEMQRIAVLAAQAYRNRWQIERSFETVKQEFSLEDVRVRTFRRLRNVFSLCVVAYLFVTRHLRASPRFKGVVKAIRDNCAELSMRTHPLLANLRSLIGEERLRNITGRPRKPSGKPPGQLEFDFPDAV